MVALRVPGGAAMSRGEIDGYGEFVKIYGAKGLAWIKVNDAATGREGLQSPDRQEPARPRHRRNRQAHRRRERRPDLLRRRQGQGRQRRDRRAAREGRPQRVRQGPRPGRGRVEAAVGDRFPDVRVRRGRPALERGAPPVHLAQGRPRGLAGDRPGPLRRQGLRRRAQRHRARGRLGPYPPRGRAEQGVPRAEDRRRGGAGQVRLPAGRAAVRRAARTAASPSAWTAS